MTGRATRAAGCAVFVLLISSACAPDGPDAYTASGEEDAAVVTRALRDPVPSESAPAAGVGDDRGEAIEEAVPNGEVVQPPCRSC